MAKPKKTPRPKAAAPKGFRDYFGADVKERAAMLAEIAAVYDLYGFEALETSAVETVEALGKFLPDVDRPNEGVFAWQEEDSASSDGWVALRYDMTAPLARVYAEHRNDLPTPYRRYAMGPVWRNEKPGPGRFRQFYQCDADTVGTASMAADAEICAMLADVFERLGLGGDYIIRINNRKVLNGVMEAVRYTIESQYLDFGAGPVVYKEKTLTTQQAVEERLADVMRSLDKFDKVGAVGVSQLLQGGREDESGAFIPGIGLNEITTGQLIAFLEARSGTNADTLGRLEKVVEFSEVGLEGVRELGEIVALLEAQGYGPDRIVIDPSVVRGLGYYTGPVYEAELTFEVKDEKGRPRQFGSVAGGGRYDDLVKRITGQEVPATGVSIGVDRLLAALRMRRAGAPAPEGPVVVTVMDRDRMADYQAMVADLRRDGIRAEVYLGNPKNFGNQMKYADRRGAPVAVIQGSDEASRGVVQLKDLVLGARIAETATLEEWKDRPAQIEVPRDQLASEVRKMIEARGA
ncbi:MAG: histidine--tRNA ligase [Shimia sp.]